MVVGALPFFLSGHMGPVDAFFNSMSGFTTPGAAPGRYRLLSPISRVDPADPPTFLAHGGDDEIVPPGESELLAGMLREAGVPHRPVGLPWANHTFDFSWDGWGSQIICSSLEEFLESRLEAPEDARTDLSGSTEGKRP